MLDEAEEELQKEKIIHSIVTLELLRPGGVNPDDVRKMTVLPDGIQEFAKHGYEGRFIPEQISILHEIKIIVVSCSMMKMQELQMFIQKAMNR